LKEQRWEPGGVWVLEPSRENIVAAAVVKWFQSLIEEYEGPRTYEAFRRYLEERLREKLKRVEELLVEIGCSYP